MSETPHPIQLCIYCPRLCHHVCPVATVERSESVTPTGLMSILRLEHDSEYNVDAQQAIHELMEHCLLCGRCTQACVHEATPWEHILDYRWQAQTFLQRQQTKQNETTSLWQPTPFKTAGKGYNKWLLIASGKGLDLALIQKQLSLDKLRRWHLLSTGLPIRLYDAWATGDSFAWQHYLTAIRKELAKKTITGIAWADPHEGEAVKSVCQHLRWQGEQGYAPLLLGLTEQEKKPCHRLDYKWGCCGATGGYAENHPEMAAELAKNFDLREVDTLPGLCLHHLNANGVTCSMSDWGKNHA